MLGNSSSRPIGVRPAAQRYRSVFISDLHLGTPGCKADCLLDFLHHVESEYLYLIGDVVDGWRLKKRWFWPERHSSCRADGRCGCPGPRASAEPYHDEALRKLIGGTFAGARVLHDAIHQTADGRRQEGLKGAANRIHILSPPTQPRSGHPPYGSAGQWFAGVMAEVYERLKEYIGFSAGVTVAVLGLLISKDDFVRMYDSGQTVRLSLSSILLFTTLIWFFSYYRSVRDELSIIIDTFDEMRVRSVARLRGPIFPIGIGLGLGFGGLIAFCAKITIYSALAWGLAMVDLYGSAAVNRNIGVLILSRHFRGEHGEQKAEVLLSYYFERALLLRIAVILTAFASALFLAFSAPNDEDRWHQYAAYLIVIITIVVGLFYYITGGPYVTALLLK